MARKAPTKNDTKTITRDRVGPQFAILRMALIHIKAGRGEATREIAEALKVDRSYVIRLTSLSMKPTSPAEKAIMKLVQDEATGLQRLGMGFALKDGFETTLAGDDGKRGHGGGRPRNDAKPKAPAKKASPAKKAKSAPKADSPKKASPPKAKAKPLAKKASAPKPTPEAKPVKAKPAKTPPQRKPKPGSDGAEGVPLPAVSAPAPDADLLKGLTAGPMGDVASRAGGEG